MVIGQMGAEKIVNGIAEYMMGQSEMALDSYLIGFANVFLKGIRGFRVGGIPDEYFRMSKLPMFNGCGKWNCTVGIDQALLD